MRHRFLSIVACISMAFFFLFLLFSTQAMPAPVNDTFAPLITATPSPPIVFSATLIMTPSQRLVAISDTLEAVISVEVSEGCIYPIYELTLFQLGSDDSLFAYQNPPTHTIGPPVSNPFTFTLTAVHTGTAILSARTYGERYCQDYWNWTYVSGELEYVRVGSWPYHSYLPMLNKN